MATSKRLSETDKDMIKDSVTRMLNTILPIPKVPESLADRVHEKIMAPYAPIIESLPEEMFSSVNFIELLPIGPITSQTTLQFSRHLVWPVRRVSTPLADIGPRYSMRQVSLIEGEPGAWGGVLDELTAVIGAREDVIRKRDAVVATLRELLARCSTSGQLLSVLPQLRDMLPHYMQSHKATNRGVVGIEAKVTWACSKEQMISYLAQYKLRGGQ